jgi:hypothetical protein
MLALRSGEPFKHMAESAAGPQLIREVTHFVDFERLTDGLSQTDPRSLMRSRLLNWILPFALGIAVPLGSIGCQSNSPAAVQASHQQEARKRLLQKRREAIAKREQREQELQDAKNADELKPDPSMIPSLR